MVLKRRRLFSPLVSFTLLLSLALAFLTPPWPPLLKMRALGFGLDPQRPHHSFFLGAEQMPIEARKVGIYAGFALAAGWLAWRASRAARLPAAGYAAGLLGIAIMGFDGTNALLYDLGGPHLYAPRLDLRLGTGLLCGLGMATLLYPVWAQTAWQAPWDKVRGSVFLVPIFLAVGVWVGLVTEQAWLMVPVSLVATLGLVGVVALMNGIGLLVVLRRESAATTALELLDVLTLSSWLAVAELLSLAALRYVLIGTTPLP